MGRVRAVPVWQDRRSDVILNCRIFISNRIIYNRKTDIFNTVHCLRPNSPQRLPSPRAQYRGAGKSLARPGRKQANVSVRTAWISFGAKLLFLSERHEFPSVPCLAEKKKTLQLATLCCWNRARSWHSSELVSFLVRLRTYQHHGTLHLFPF